MFRVLLTLAVGFAIMAHAQWGCSACHCHVVSLPTSLHELSCHVEHEDCDGHSHSDEHHPGQPCTSDCHCYFVLRLPTTFMPDLDWSGVTPFVALPTLNVVVHAQAPTAATVPLDVGSLLFAARQTQHQVLRL